MTCLLPCVSSRAVLGKPPPFPGGNGGELPPHIARRPKPPPMPSRFNLLLDETSNPHSQTDFPNTDPPENLSLELLDVTMTLLKRMYDLTSRKNQKDSLKKIFFRDENIFERSKIIFRVSPKNPREKTKSLLQKDETYGAASGAGLQTPACQEMVEIKKVRFVFQLWGARSSSLSKVRSSP